MRVSRYTQIYFGLRCMFPTWSDWNIEYTPKGLRKLRARQAARALGIGVLVAGTFWMRQSGLGLADMPSLLRHGVRSSLGVLEGWLESVRARI